MSNINRCDFCCSEDLSSPYMPIGSDYEVSVKQCNKCYLIQSFKIKMKGITRLQLALMLIGVM